MRRVAVAGLGLIPVKEYWDRSTQDLFAEAALKAMKDAGTDKVDSVYVANMSGALMQDQVNMGALAAGALGRPGLPSIRVEAGTASGGVAFHEAVKTRYGSVPRRTFELFCLWGGYPMAVSECLDRSEPSHDLLQELLDVVYDGVEIERLQVQDLLAAESQQLPRERGGAFPGFLNLIDIRKHLVAGR